MDAKKNSDSVRWKPCCVGRTGGQRPLDCLHSPLTSTPSSPPLPPMVSVGKGHASKGPGALKGGLIGDCGFYFLDLMVLVRCQTSTPSLSCPNFSRSFNTPCEIAERAQKNTNVHKVALTRRPKSASLRCFQSFVPVATVCDRVDAVLRVNKLAKK